MNNEELTKEDFESETWRKLEIIFKESLNNIRKQNDNQNIDINETNYARGAIGMLKNMIKLNPANHDEDI